MGLRSWLAGRFRQKSLGQRGEDAATRYLKRTGYRILARGLDSRLGELDIIAVEDRTIVFVEVKTRTSTGAGHPTDAIDATKQRRMTQAALAYLKSHGLMQHAARFDVIAITWGENVRTPKTVEHLKNAFDATGRGQFYN
jgi:putative endonuclease